MLRGELIKWVADRATEFSKECKESVERNSHLTGLEDLDVTQEQIDAILTGFVNHCGFCQGLDYAMASSDLKK